MKLIDPLIVLIYLVAMVVIGFWCARKSASGMRSYFQGSNKAPWWILAASGSTSN